MHKLSERELETRTLSVTLYHLDHGVEIMTSLKEDPPSSVWVLCGTTYHGHNYWPSRRQI